jgi:tRNA(His) 5'-end guanylyltransferase
VVNGRSFKKTTSLLHKPFSPTFLEIMAGVMVKLACEIDGTVFAYSFNDEIVIISRNDQHQDTTAWLDNRIQKIASIVASIATFEFVKLLKVNDLNILGDPIFAAKTFIVPNITEVINLLISKQQQAFHSALSMACWYELIKKFSVETVRQTLNEKSAQAKSEILLEEVGIDFNHYPLPFRRGIATYRTQKIIDTPNGKEMRHKLIIDAELPIFTKDQSFLTNILSSGKDIIRL